jgi:hypothetical protein
MWLANSKRQPCFYPAQSHAQEDTQNLQKKKGPQANQPYSHNALMQGSNTRALFAFRNEKSSEVPPDVTPVLCETTEISPNVPRKDHSKCLLQLYLIFWQLNWSNIEFPS